MSREIIDALANNNNVEAETKFGTSLSSKIGDALEIQRRELAKTFVKTMSVKNETD